MKKLIAIAALLALLYAAPVLADPQIVTVGDRVMWVETVTGDASGDGEIVISATRANFHLLGGRYLYELITVPGTAAATPAAWTGDIKDGVGRPVLEIATRSTTETETIPGYQTLGHYPVIVSSWTGTLTGIGEGNTVTVYLVFD